MSNFSKVQSNCPKNFRVHDFEHTFKVKSHYLERFWQTLQLRETFVKGQFFPYKVEFDSPEQFGPFQEGELNVHHGPLLSVHGAIGKVSADFRGLDYFYGSYVLSFRLVRPVCLEFYKLQGAVKVRFKSYVHPWFLPFWKLGCAFFWKLFGVEWTLRSKMARQEKMG